MVAFHTVKSQCCHLDTVLSINTLEALYANNSNFFLFLGLLLFNLFFLLPFLLFTS